MSTIVNDPLQAVRVEACRLAAQIMAGTGADPGRVLGLVTALALAMMPTSASAPAPEPAKKSPFSVIDGDKTPA